MSLLSIHAVSLILVDRMAGGDALRYSTLVLGIALVVDGTTLAAVGRPSLFALRSLLEFVGAGVEVDAAHGIRGHELSDVVQPALERAVSELERLLDFALSS